MNSIENAPSVETSATPASKPVVVNPPEKPAKAKPPVLKVAGNTIDLDELHKVLNAVNSEIGRAIKVAEASGHITLAKDCSGGGRAVVSVANVRKLHSLNLLHTDKAKSKAILDRVVGLNHLVDGLALLGLAKRTVIS